MEDPSYINKAILEGSNAIRKELGDTFAEISNAGPSMFAPVYVKYHPNLITRTPLTFDPNIE